MAGKRSKNGTRMKAMGGGMKSKNGTRMKAMGGGAMMKKKNYAKGGRVKLVEGSPRPTPATPSKPFRIPKAEQDRIKEMLPDNKRKKKPQGSAPDPIQIKKNKVDEAMKKRKEAMGGGAMMKKKNYAKGGPARTKMANGGKMVKGPYS
jgi:hypothetical protein